MKGVNVNMVWIMFCNNKFDRFGVRIEIAEKLWFIFFYACNWYEDMRIPIKSLDICIEILTLLGNKRKILYERTSLVKNWPSKFFNWQ